MRASSLLLRSFVVSSVASTPFGLGSLFGPDSAQSSPSDSAHWSPPTQPGVPSAKLLVGHFIVESTYKYHEDDWIQQIALATTGINALALNIG
ncbi:hypothetical protein MVEN_00214300 [Mycena venus]|uniref:Uncharacterized protein n=1 Tax=Mycena venus TaxID=2733690 RepID=A0A8H6Z404_9AGAR|nr:hypothetical protein MVEN_00214300 [Mycena venus]